jgi:2-C-methyl-D-erythritol 4-phosphate cytidylyltransferase/2-C-methyl-D-erythritol 2,4-cyclodiphosphate synthase
VATCCWHVLIHDGARPLVSPEVIAGVVAALETGAVAAAPALPVTDALWRAADGRVTGAASREGLMRAQTPQGFRAGRHPGRPSRHPEGRRR